MGLRSYFGSLVFLLLVLPHVHTEILSRSIVSDDRIQTYIVHVDRPSSELLSQESWHRSFLPDAALDSGEPRLVYSYTHVISGFAARLTADEARAMESMDGFVSAVPDEVIPPLTTYTPKFLNLSLPVRGAWSKSSKGEGMIIGVVDSGISPTHPSFGDHGISPPPSRWKGRCSKSFGCNNKLIGAVSFINGHRNRTAAIDDTGHGTLVAGIAVGNFVHRASVLGTARGTASGTAPRAHLAVYKACNVNVCKTSDVLAGIDEAIEDGVDVINISLGIPKEPSKFTQDPFALASFAAIKKGIVAVTAAGNTGPEPETISHGAPWMVTVGATTTDRRIRVRVRLGNGQEFDGETAYQPGAFNSSLMIPIVDAGANGSWFGRYCFRFKNIDVTGKIVVCRAGQTSNSDKSSSVGRAGGAAMIVVNEQEQGNTTWSDPNQVPAANVNFFDGRRILSYVADSVAANSTPTATFVFDGTQFGYRPSPSLAYFSSRGPSTSNGGILKPDVLAPGVNILSSYPFEVGTDTTGNATSTFNFLSGTSLATPHVAGIAALLKGKHPSWSPAAIGSAIVTSAIDVDLDGALMLDDSTNEESFIFGVGAGLVNAMGALDPGLVYDLDPDDYVKYFCGLGYTDSEVRIICGQKSGRCSTVAKIKPWELNYPSISWHVESGSTEITLQRNVTNVGPASSFYRARLTVTEGLYVRLSHYQLRFTKSVETASFNVTLRINASEVIDSSHMRGKLEWISETHVVTSPIAVLFS